MKRFFSLLLVPAVLLCACAAPAPWEGAEPYEVEATAGLLRDFALEKEDGGPSGASVWTAPSAFGYRSADNRQEILSLPYVIYRYTDIAEGEATWTAELRLAELSRSPQGEAAPSGGASAVSCRNVELSFGCGARTVLVRAWEDGRLRALPSGERAGAGERLAVERRCAAGALQPDGATAGDVFAALEGMKEDGGGGLFGGLVTAAGVSFTGYELRTPSGPSEEGGDCALFAVNAAREGAEGCGSTPGVLQVSFDVYWEEEPLASVSASVPFGYTVAGAEEGS